MDDTTRFKRIRGTFQGHNAVYKDTTNGVLSHKLSSEKELADWIVIQMKTAEAQAQVKLDDPPPPDTTYVMPVIRQGAFPVDGRSLHAALGIGRDFSTWMKTRLAEAQMDQDEDYTVAEVREGSLRRIEYSLTMDASKHIAMLERTALGHQVRRYFLECERSLEVRRLNFDDPLEAARMYIEAETARREAVLQLDDAKVKLEGVEQEVSAKTDQIELLLAKLEAPARCVTLTQFAKETESILGMTQPILFQYLRDVGILGRKPASKWDDENVVLAPYNGCGYFQYSRHSFGRPARNEAGEVEAMASVTKTTPKLTPDVMRDGQRVRIGGFSWLSRYISKDPRATLCRLVARDGGREGRWAPLYGARMFPSQTEEGLVCAEDPSRIFFWRSPGKRDVTRYVACRFTVSNDGTRKAYVKGHGLTLEDALEKLLDATPAGSVKPLIKSYPLDE